MKKLISILLASIMVISSSLPVLASEKPVNQNNLIENMVIAGVSEVIEEKTISKDKKLYVLDTADVIAKVTEEDVATGTLYTFEEGNITNEVLYQDNGDIYLDGNLVEITVEDSVENTVSSEIMPRAYYEYWEIGDDPFSGRESSYNQDERESKVRAALGEAISDIALTTFASIVLGAVVGMKYGAVAGAAGTVAGVISGAGLAIYHEYQRMNNPSQTVAYIRKTTWTKGSHDLTSSPLKYYYKIRTEYSYDYNFPEEAITSTDEFFGMHCIVNH